jgi:ATP-dependent helicase/nuclease subunit B
MRFTRCYTQNTICTPSRVSLISGQYCHNHGFYGLGGPRPDWLPGSFSHFKKHGYRTAGIGKLHLPTTPRIWLEKDFDYCADSYFGMDGNQEIAPWCMEIKARGLDFAHLDDQKLRVILQEQIASLAAGDSFLANFARHGPHNAFILHNAADVLEDCVLAIAQMVRAGSFEPMLSEVSFGPGENGPDALGKCELALPGGRILSLSGKIDRLDTANRDGDDIAIVFDYKRRFKRFSWARFSHGIDMQLPIYMLAVRNASGRKTTRRVIGAFYMPVEVGTESAAVAELPGTLEKYRHKANGMFNGDFFRELDESDSNKFYNFFVTTKGDQYGYDSTSGALRPDDFQRVLQYAQQRIIRMAQEILSGRIEISPYRIGTESPCGFCKYKPVCRFDWQINDYNPLPSLGKKEALERMGRADG